MISQFNAFTSFQVNVNASGQNITGDAANEPSIAVDPTNRNKMTIGWRQFNSVTSNFRQAGWGLHHQWRHDLDLSRRAREQCLSQRPGLGLR